MPSYPEGTDIKKGEEKIDAIIGSLIVGLDTPAGYLAEHVHLPCPGVLHRRRNSRIRKEKSDTEVLQP